MRRSSSRSQHSTHVCQPLPCRILGSWKFRGKSQIRERMDCAVDWHNNTWKFSRKDEVIKGVTRPLWVIPGTPSKTHLSHLPQEPRSWPSSRGSRLDIATKNNSDLSSSKLLLCINPTHQCHVASINLGFALRPFVGFVLRLILTYLERFPFKFRNFLTPLQMLAGNFSSKSILAKQTSFARVFQS
jgi:hypothetical protein